MRPDAPWTASLFSHERWLESLPAGRLVPSFFLHVHGAAVEMVMVDGLHTIDLGVGAHIIGEVLTDKRAYTCGGGNIDEA